MRRRRAEARRALQSADDAAPSSTASPAPVQPDASRSSTPSQGTPRRRRAAERAERARLLTAADLSTATADTSLQTAPQPPSSTASPTASRQRRHREPQSNTTALDTLSSSPAAATAAQPMVDSRSLAQPLPPPPELAVSSGQGRSETDALDRFAEYERHQRLHLESSLVSTLRRPASAASRSTSGARWLSDSQQQKPGAAATSKLCWADSDDFFAQDQQALTAGDLAALLPANSPLLTQAQAALSPQPPEKSVSRDAPAASPTAPQPTTDGDGSMEKITSEALLGSALGSKQVRSDG